MQKFKFQQTNSHRLRLPITVSSSPLLATPETESPLSTTPPPFILSTSLLDFSLILNEMAEQKRPPKNRGFYLRMKLPPKHARPQQDKNCFYKYYKWFLWLSLSLYFFTSCLISNNNPHTKPTSFHQSHLSTSQSTLPSRALFESSNITALNAQGTHKFGTIHSFLLVILQFLFI